MIDVVVDLSEVEMMLQTVYTLGHSMTNTNMQRRARVAMQELGTQRFYNFVDLRASEDTSLAHVYEWDMRGNPAGRLFKLVPQGTSGISTVQWLPSTKLVPLPEEEDEPQERSRHIFQWKAPVSEFSQGVWIRAGEAEHRESQPSGENPRFLVWFSQSGKRRLWPEKFQDFSFTRGRFTAMWNSFWNTRQSERLVEAPVAGVVRTMAMRDFPRELSAAVMYGRSRSAKVAPGTATGGVHFRSLGRPVGMLNVNLRKTVSDRIRRVMYNRLRALS